jgi:hypothetical protein
MVGYEFSVEAECGYILTETKEWRELQWSMSWLRPGGKKALIRKLSYKIFGLYIGIKQNTRVRSNLPKSN